MRCGATLLSIVASAACGRFGFDGYVDAQDAAGGDSMAGCTAQIAASWDNSCAIKQSEVWCWGQNTNSQLGPNAGADAGPVVIPLGVADRVVIGNDTLCAHLVDDQIWCWGQGLYGQLGASLVEQPTPIPITGFPNALPPKQVTGGGDHHCALASDGTVACWGANTFYQLGTSAALETCGATPCSTTPVLVSGLTQVTQLVSGQDHTCALSNQTVLCWGQNNYGQLADTTTTARATPMPVMGLSEPVAQIAGTNDHSCAVTMAGTVYCWGSNNARQLGALSGEQCPTLGDCSTVALQVGWQSPSPATKVAAGGQHTCAVDGNGRVWCWGQNDDGQLGIAPAAADVMTPVDPNIVSVAELAAGDAYTCARMRDGTLSCWGQNDLGQLGNGSITAAAPASPVITICP